MKNIEPRGRTNIYGSIQEAYKLIEERDDKTRNSAIMMLTDGEPTISPARGETETLKILESKKNFNTPLYTYGFGYSLQRTLLYDLAKIGSGTTGHIPDGGMIATVFCNAISNIKLTISQNIIIIRLARQKLFFSLFI